MSIHINKKRNKWFICYKEKTETGYKTITITNNEWDIKNAKCPYGLTRKYMQSIEEEQIKMDRASRKFELKTKTSYKIVDDAMMEFYKVCYATRKVQTADLKKYAMNKHFIPYISSELPIEKALTTQAITKVYDKVVAQSFCNKRKNTIFGIIKEFLQFCSDREYLTYENSNKLKSLLRKVETQDKYDETNEGISNVTENYWENEEWDKFYNTFNHEERYWRLFFEVAYTGLLRINEVRSLKFKDIDFTNNTISILRSMDRHGNLTTTKSVSSTRVNVFPASTIEQLKQLMEENSTSKDDFVFFPTHHASETTIRRVFSKHIELANIKPITIHGLKHSGVSRLYNAGVPVGFISKQAGHSDVGVTYRHYTHIFKRDNSDLVNMVFNFTK